MGENRYSLKDDFQLWQAFKAGDEKAFDCIYDTYFSPLYGYGTRLCPDKALVKDCIQNLFVSLWNNRTHLSDVHSIKYYLYKSLRRAIVKELQLENRFLHPEDMGENYHFEVAFSHEFLLITEQISQENQNRLLNAFHSLTKRQKEAVFLRFYENLDYTQIASILSMKDTKYARTLVYRALDVLKAGIRKLATVQ
jgi:RNA polymerase sigma factor (sigma-70 family)